MQPRSTEYGGLAQSGYTAGRRGRDLALERQVQTHYDGYPRGVDEEEALKEELGTDDRWTGRGRGPTAA